MSYNLYLLKNTENNRTYVGITNNLERRIRQHNGEIKGGAKYTHNFKGNGEWQYHLHISGLTKSESLSLERSVKNTKCNIKGSTIDRRMYAINKYLHRFPDCKVLFKSHP
tara:strand:+ start:328 stop:657 length:330 start_codon:yes stop_codon:yes gene_type:complete